MADRQLASHTQRGGSFRAIEPTTSSEPLIDVQLAMGGTTNAASDLVRLMQRGDRDAFAELVRPELGRLVRLASAIVGNEPDAHDALQETLTIAWRRRTTLRDRDRFRAWVTRILVNESQRVVKKRRRVSVADTAAMDRPSASSAVSSLEERVIAQNLLERAFERLEPRQMALLALHHLDQHPIDEIGEVLGLRPGTVKSQLFSARKALADALATEDRDEFER